ncbi:hypothetical protein NL676_014184 [Syzygium grande]|nr:hypothetical protein NL676_014184 [Syzygium grande]
MDSDEEKLQYLGFLGIFKESFKIVVSWKKIFTQITLSFILPLSILFLVQIHVSEYLERRIRFVRYRLYHRGDEDEYLSSERLEYWLIKIAYLVFLLVLSLLSTSAVVYTVACNYTGKPITFKKIMSVVPKVWKRVTITFIWSFLIHLAYSLCFLGAIVMWAMLIGFSSVGIAIWYVLLILFFVGFVYLSIVWQLASVVSVLEEESYGIKAMVKSINLIEGKATSHELHLPAAGLVLLWDIDSVPVVCGVFMEHRNHVIYFVCKSYHCESIDKPALAHRLEAYFQSEPQRDATKDVQLEQVHVAAKDAQLDQVYV